MPVTIATAVVAGVIALALVGCSDDSDDKTTEATTVPEELLSRELRMELKIERTGNRWARHFAAGRAGDSCRYMTQPGCEQITCRRISGPIEACTPPSSEYRRSFAYATVQDIVIMGNRAAARFSNGEAVELYDVNGSKVGGVWWVSKVGGNAGRKFFKAAGTRE